MKSKRLTFDRRKKRFIKVFQLIEKMSKGPNVLSSLKKIKIKSPFSKPHYSWLPINGLLRLKSTDWEPRAHYFGIVLWNKRHHCNLWLRKCFWIASLYDCWRRTLAILKSVVSSKSYGRWLICFPLLFATDCNSLVKTLECRGPLNA